MNFYKQCDPKWGSLKLGTCSDTICQSGCFLCCLSMLSNTPPDQANEILKGGGYTGGCLINSEASARLLGLEYKGISKTKPNYDTIAETNYYKPKGVPQHFFIIKADGSQVDPLGKSIVYPIVSYRLFKGKDEMIQQNDLDGRVFTYKGMGLLWVKPEWIGKDQNDTSKPLPNTWAISVRDLPIDCSDATRPLQDTINELGSDLKTMKDLLEDETELNAECVTEKDKLQTQIDEHKCEVKEMTAWEHFKMFISKLIERK